MNGTFCIHFILLLRQLFISLFVLDTNEKTILHIICGDDPPFWDASFACHAFVWRRNIGCKAFI